MEGELGNISFLLKPVSSNYSSKDMTECAKMMIDEYGKLTYNYVMGNLLIVYVL